MVRDDGVEAADGGASGQQGGPGCSRATRHAKRDELAAQRLGVARNLRAAMSSVSSVTDVGIWNCVKRE